MKQLLLCVLLLVSCAPSTRSVRSLPASTGSTLVLVESNPVETTLDHPDIPDAFELWPKLIDTAKRSIEVAQFYVSNESDSRLEPVILSLERAAARGVSVRFLAEEKFYKTYPETLDRLRANPRIQLRRYNVGPLMGGILHAKYFIVDKSTAYLGSQNMDWRALEHIQELGVEVQDPNTVKSLGDVFETDWQLAGGAPADTRIRRTHPDFPSTIQSADGVVTRITPVFSPKGFLPDEQMWDLPRLVQLIDSAKQTVRVQLLTYKTASKHGRFADLDDALIRAGARGVKVEMIVSSWATRKGTWEGLNELSQKPGLTVRVITIPPFSGGEIPFARVAHAKYLAVDGDRGWVGTSNWERDYFYASRNVGLIIEGAAWIGRLERFFDDNWNSKYVGPLPSAPSVEQHK